MYTDKVDRDTMICRDHTIEACVACMVDDFYNWLDVKKDRRLSLKEERRRLDGSRQVRYWRRSVMAEDGYVSFDGLDLARLF